MTLQHSDHRPPTWLLVACVAFVLVLVGSCALLSLYQRGQLVQTAESPDGVWQVRVYVVAVGATGSDVLRATAKRRGGGEREVLKTDRLWNVEYTDDYSDTQTIRIRWLGGSRASLGGYIVDLSTGHVRDY